jgi:hypothetical protein
MKHFLASLILFLFSLTILSQPQNEFNKKVSGLPVHSRGDMSFSGSVNILLNTPNSMQLAGGVKMRIFLGKRISFDTDLVFGRDYFHASIGVFGVPLWMLLLGSHKSSEKIFDASSEDAFEFSPDLLFCGIFMILSAEHTSFHFPVKNSLDISPYFSLLRYKSAYEYGIYSNTNMTNQQESFAAGLELNKYYKRFLLSPYLEYNIGYVDHVSGFNAGIYCGMFFLNKK